MKHIKNYNESSIHFIDNNEFKDALEKYVEGWRKLHLLVFKLGAKLTPEQIEELNDSNLTFDDIIKRSENIK